MKFLVINGPNLNFLGIREPDIYGKNTFAQLLASLDSWGKELGIEVEQYQSNHEGDLVDRIQEAYEKVDGIVINPAAYTHTSVAILDALKAVGIPAVEVHISDVDARESFSLCFPFHVLQTWWYSPKEFLFTLSIYHTMPVSSTKKRRAALHCPL